MQGLYPVGLFARGQGFHETLAGLVGGGGHGIRYLLAYHLRNYLSGIIHARDHRRAQQDDNENKCFQVKAHGNVLNTVKPALHAPAGRAA